MVAVENSDHNAEEPANLWHLSTLATSLAQQQYHPQHNQHRAKGIGSGDVFDPFEGEMT